MPSPIISEFLWLLRQARAPQIRTLREFAFAELVVPKGRYRGSLLRPDVQPYVGLLLDALDSGRYTRAAICGCVQSGKSLVGFVLPILYYLFEFREPVVVGVPTMIVGRDKWNKELLPAIAASRYADLLPMDGSGSRGGWSEEITFGNGAALKFMSGKGGDEKRSSYTARIAVLTEVDKMDRAGDTSRETDPVGQIEGRTASYPEDERRLLEECTVSIPAGRIWSDYQAGTASAIVCPCPHCGQYVAPEREHLAGWREAETEQAARLAAHFCCPACGQPLSDAQRREMNQAARLLHRGQSIDPAGQVAGDPPPTQTLGFRWSAFHNLFWSPAELGALEWAAVRSPHEEGAERKLRQFYWSIPWSPPELDAAPLDPDVLRQRFADRAAGKGQLPPGTEYLSVGIDLGKRYGHWVAIAWRAGGCGTIIDYSTFEVPSAGMAVERALVAALETLRDEVLLTAWARPVDQAWIDAGYQPEAVYAFCRQPTSRNRCRPALGYGASQPDRRFRSYHQPTSTGAQAKLLGLEYHVLWVPAEKCFRVDVSADFWKSWLQDGLRTPPGEPGSIDLYYSTDRHEHTTLAQHFAAEEPTVEFVPGRGEVIRWIKKKRGNHYLDAAYNACAAAHLCGVRRLPAAARQPPPVAPPAATSAPGSPYLLIDRR